MCFALSDIERITRPRNQMSGEEKVVSTHDSQYLLYYDKNLTFAPLGLSAPMCPEHGMYPTTYGSDLLSSIIKLYSSVNVCASTRFFCETIPIVEL